MGKTIKTVPDIEPIQVAQTNKKRIHQYELSGKYVQTFESIAEAQKSLGVKGVGIYRAIQGKAKSCHGFQWRIATE